MKIGLIDRTGRIILEANNLADVKIKFKEQFHKDKDIDEFDSIWTLLLENNRILEVKDDKCKC